MRNTKAEAKEIDKMLISYVQSEMSLRCKLQGCMYGIEGIDKEPKDYCIWCGRERIKGHFTGVSLPDVLDKIKKENSNVISKHTK